MTIEAIMQGLVEIAKLINFYNANLAPAEAAKQVARWAKVSDFLFGWIDRLQPTAKVP